MHHIYIELLTFLHCNIDLLWNATTVDTCMKRQVNAGGDRDEDDSDVEVAGDGVWLGLWLLCCYITLCVVYAVYLRFVK